MKTKFWMYSVVILLSLIVGGCASGGGGSESTAAEAGEPPADGSTNEESAAEQDDNAQEAAEETASGETVEVRMLGTIKGEIGPQFEDAISTYNEAQDAYEIVIVPMDGSNPVEKMTTLYASGNAPNLMVMGQEYSQFQENLLDLTETEFSKHALPGTQDLVTVDGRIFGMPVTVEAFGLLYNDSILDEAVGGDFDPATINSRSTLQELMEQIAALESANAIHVSPMDWSLGAHLTNKMFTNQSPDAEERRQFMEDLKNGDVSLIDNEVFNGWLDTFDLLMAQNVNAGSPLSPDYDQGTLDLGNGDVGLWFMGNWAFPQLKEINSETDFGILPLPVSDDPDTYGNNQVSVGVPFYIVVDASQSSAAEQQGAIDFLNWLVMDPVGQDYYVNQFNFIPVFDTFDIRPQDALSNQILDYVSQEQTLEWMNSLYPPDGWPTMGASMQKYLDGRITREELAAEIEEYWASVEG